jgi:hypothetical protein
MSLNDRSPAGSRRSSPRVHSIGIIHDTSGVSLAGVRASSGFRATWGVTSFMRLLAAKGKTNPHPVSDLHLRNLLQLHALRFAATARATGY